jgi:hypothetical protein
MSTTYEPRSKHPVSTQVALLIGTGAVAITAGWVLFLFFVVPALMK